MDYPQIKLIHQSATALTITGFFLRGAASLAGAAWVQGRTARIVPPIIDTVLLVSALVLAWTLRVHPGNAPWLTAKLCGLVVYIVLGIVALKPTVPRRWRAAAWIGALATVGWMVSVAITKQPLGFLA